MGCVSSKQDINDIHPNIFNVMNVNENGQNISHGQLELTESELILFQRGKTETRWPLRCLRRYGFDSEIFSFEAGRRCTTGPGIYAFRCRRAEQLFNLLQSYIQLRNLSDDLASVAMNDLQIPAITSGPPVTSRNPEGQYQPQSQSQNRIQNFRLSRPGSVTSNGPPSPPIGPTTPLVLPQTAPTFIENQISTNQSTENNNNKRTTHEYCNSIGPILGGGGGGGIGISVSQSEVNTQIENQNQQPYMNLIEPKSPTLSSNSEPYAQLNLVEMSEDHVYINVTPGEQKLTQGDTRKSSIQDVLILESDPEEQHCYANLNPEDIENMTIGLLGAQNPIPQNVGPHSINYIVLDLKESNSSSKTQNEASNLTVENDTVAKGYATIDFNKTVALSNSVNHPNCVMDNEGSRKTRHNSTIGDIAPILARHSTSLSD